MKGRIFLFLAIILAIVAGLSRLYPFNRTPPEVTLEPRPGTYGEEISVALFSEKGATIYFTLGDKDELPYIGPVRIRRNTVIRYFAVDRWSNRTEERVAEYVVRLDREPPVTTARPRPGKYNHPVSVRLKSEEGAVIRFTTDDNELDGRSAVYKKAITLRKDTLLKYYAVDAAGNIEETKIAKYSITIDTAKPVTLVDPAGGLYKSAVTVSLAGEQGSKIYYSLDGSRPSRRSPLYIEPITFARSGVLRFFAIDQTGNMENLREERYIIDRDPPMVSSKPPPGTYGKGVTVTLASSERGKIRYELGEQEPSMSSPVYTAP
ncbi:MAG: chitobiase/beta-hexosaminidase C-terminal domain-containing protein, partial [bacterium]